MKVEGTVLYRDNDGKWNKMRARYQWWYNQENGLCKGDKAKSGNCIIGEKNSVEEKIFVNILKEKENNN